MKTSGLVLCLYGFFCLFVLITDSLSLLVISLFKLFLLDSVLVSSIFLQGCPFHLSCQIYWHIIVLSIPLVFFFFLWYWLLYLFFNFLFCLFGFCLFSWWAWPEVYQFYLLFQRPSSWFYWLFPFFNCYFIFYLYSFFLLTLGFVCSFSDSFRWYVTLFIWDFSCFFFLRKACITVNF